jgi:hypothetical protein
MARSPDSTPTIADLLDRAAEGGSILKLDKYLDTLEPDVRERVEFHLRAKKPDGSWALASRKIAQAICDDPSTATTLSPSAIDKWRAERAADAS